MCIIKNVISVIPVFEMPKKYHEIKLILKTRKLCYLYDRVEVILSNE